MKHKGYDLLDQVRRGTHATRGIWPQLTAKTGVPNSTIKNIANCETTQVGFATLVKLHKGLTSMRICMEPEPPPVRLPPADYVDA